MVLDQLRLVISFNLICFCLCGCSWHVAPLPAPEVRAQHAAELAQHAGWQSYSVQTNSFVLQAYGSRILSHPNVLRIYIEGDGLAWISPTSPSDNPTPVVSTGLEMALHDQHHPIVYLARPCQFVAETKWRGCRDAYWTNLRFSPEVIAAMNLAVDQLKKKYHAKKIMLIGYSGGGTVATLLAARRSDVVKLVTVAAILDIRQWTTQANLTPLYGSLNPADEWKNLINTPQTHWVGGKDQVVPVENARVYASKFPLLHQPEIKVMPMFDHACCWTKLQLVA